VRNSFLKALVSGSIGSIVSTLALAACGWRELDDACAPLNGPSQWLFGRPAAYRSGFSARHTIAGCLIHHSMSVLWALLFERLRGRSRSAARAAFPAAATSAVACFVDYQLTPKRFTPGFEQRLSRTSLASVYVAFAVGLAAGAALQDRSRR
jgi:hypothetical protein